MSKSNYHSGTKRDTCYFCSAFGNIEEHHVVPQRFGGKDVETNIVGVCSPCHKKLERLYDKSFYEWFGVEDESGERRYHTICAWKNCNNQVTRKVGLAESKWYRTDNGERVYRGKPLYLCESCAWDRAEVYADRAHPLEDSNSPAENLVKAKLEQITLERASEVSVEE